MPHLVATLIYLSQNYSYYIRGDRSPLIFVLKTHTPSSLRHPDDNMLHATLTTAHVTGIFHNDDFCVTISTLPSKHEALFQCCFNVGPTSKTAYQH